MLTDPNILAQLQTLWGEPVVENTLEAAELVTWFQNTGECLPIDLTFKGVYPPSTQWGRGCCR